MRSIEIEYVAQSHTAFTESQTLYSVLSQSKSQVRCAWPLDHTVTFRPYSEYWDLQDYVHENYKTNWDNLKLFFIWCYYFTRLLGSIFFYFKFEFKFDFKIILDFINKTVQLINEEWKDLGHNLRPHSLMWTWTAW